MKSKAKRFSVAMVAGFILMVACTHKSNLPVPVTSNNGNNQDTTIVPAGVNICFERDILPIFLSSCAKDGCHNAASYEEGYILDNYTNIRNTGDDDGIVPGNADESEIFKSLIEDDIDDIMPQYPNPQLSTAQIALIKRWINEGAQNGTNCIVLCDTTHFTYNADIKPVLQQNCIGCHNTTVSSGGVNLSTHAGVAVVAQNGRLMGSIKHQVGYIAMPQGGAQLPACKVRQVEKWVQAGALEN